MNSGIYKITNKVNGKFYIGSSLNIKQRWKYHRNNLKSGTHDNQHLQNSYNKHGKDKFIFEVVLGLDAPQAEILKAEQEMLNSYKDMWSALYNIARFTSSGMKGRSHTKEVKKILSEKLSGERHPHYGKPVSEVWRRKISKRKKRFTDEQEKVFLRRLESGESKSSIAKDAGVHPTTITRAIERVKRFNY